MTAIFDDNRLALKRADVGQGFDQHVRFLNQSVHAWLPWREKRETRERANSLYVLCAMRPIIRRIDAERPFRALRPNDNHGLPSFDATHAGRATGSRMSLIIDG